MPQEDYRKGSLTLTGQVAGLAGAWFPMAFPLAAFVAGLSVYSYVTVSSAYPSADAVGRGLAAQPVAERAMICAGGRQRTRM